jgi:hypothetical protein
MRTAATIEAQEERKKDERNSRSVSANNDPVSESRRRSVANLKPGPKGVSGNPSGRPAHDVASEIAQALFPNNAELIYEAFLKVLRKGSPYGFQVLADRAFGKLKETVRHERGPLADVPTPDLEEHIQELEAKFIAHLVEQGYTVTKPPQLLPAPVADSKVQ